MNPYQSPHGGGISISESERQTRAAESTARGTWVMAFATVFAAGVAGVSVFWNSVDFRLHSEIPVAQIANPSPAVGPQSPGSAAPNSSPATVVPPHDQTEQDGRGSPISRPKIEPPQIEGGSAPASGAVDHAGETHPPILGVPPKIETPNTIDNSGRRPAPRDPPRPDLRPFHSVDGTVEAMSNGRIFKKNVAGQIIREFKPGEPEYARYHASFWPTRY